MKKIVFILTVLFSLSFSAQQNYEWLKLKKYKVAHLNDSLNENSGLKFFNNKLYTINDGDNTSEIFELDALSGKIKNTIPTDLVNRDWEAITSDSTYIYIGDFGNNVGTRKDLMIYRIPILDSIKIDSIQKIQFYYPEQNDFIPKNLNNNFDAEAMVYVNGKIHLFTKEWESKATTHYLIDLTLTNNQPAQRLETFQMGYVVTDAAYFNRKLYLIGYTKKAEVYLTIFNESSSGIFFEEKPKKYYLGSATSIGQVEGIAVNENGIYISSERLKISFINAKPTLYFIPFNKFK